MKKIALIFFSVLLLTACSNLESSGFDQNGIHKVTKTKYNEKGYDVNGYDKSGYNKEEIDKDGYNKAGFDYNGYNRDGYDSEGYNRDGYNKKGYNRKGYDKNGYDNKGYDLEGYNKKGINKKGEKRVAEKKEESNEIERVPVKQVYKFGADIDTKMISLEEKNHWQKLINREGKIEEGKIIYVLYRPYKNDDGNIVFPAFIRNGMNVMIYDIYPYIEIYYKKQLILSGSFNLYSIGAIPSKVSVPENLVFGPKSVIREDLLEELLENVEKKAELEKNKYNAKEINTSFDVKYNTNYRN